MRAPLTFALALVAIVGIAVTLPFIVVSPAAWWLELVVVLLALAVVLMYRSYVEPMRALGLGLSLLAEEDYASRLSPVRQKDANRITQTFNDMMMRLKNERLRVQEQNQLLSLITGVSPAGIVIFSVDGTVTDYNAAAVRFLGIENLNGLRLEDIPAKIAETASQLSTGEARTVRLSDNSIIRCSMLGFVDRGFQRRFLLLESLTDEVMTAQRQAYGKVIRVISHEVNNTLAGVIPFLEASAENPDDEGMAQVAVACADRCAALSAFIRDYATVVRVPDPSILQCDLNQFVLNQLPFLESLVSGRGITVKADLAPDDVPVRMDCILMEQVLVNVVKNAAESIAERDTSDGRIILRTSAEPRMLEVIDNGTGISDTAAAGIFTPFFTTKAGGRGTGLTLVAEILSRHHLRFSLTTDPTTRLTSFVVKF